MAVERERISFAEMENVKVFKRKLCVTEMNRQKNGRWTLDICLDVEIMLPDGRIIWTMAETTIAAKQSGRRK